MLKVNLCIVKCIVIEKILKFGTKFRGFKKKVGIFQRLRLNNDSKHHK